MENVLPRTNPDFYTSDNPTTTPSCILADVKAMLSSDQHPAIEELHEQVKQIAKRSKTVASDYSINYLNEKI